MNYSKNKIKELCLVTKGMSWKCSEEIFGDQHCNGSCSSCAIENHDKHYENICKKDNFDCANCGIVLNAHPEWKGYDCDICHTEILKYIEMDFKDMFNEIERDEK